MKQRTQLLDIDAVKEAIRVDPGPKGLEVDLVDHQKCRFRIKRNHGSAYYGVTDDGRSVVMNVETGQFDISD